MASALRSSSCSSLAGPLPARPISCAPRQAAHRGDVAAPTARPWLKQAETYPDPEKPVEKPPVQPVDTISPELARLRNELLAMKLKIDELDKRKSGTTVVQPQQPAQSQAPPEKRPAQMLYYHKDIQDKITPVSTVTEYTLAPWATKLPCTIEPLMNSDVEGYFTAKVNTNVYDTATGRHLLVPQGDDRRPRSRFNPALWQ